MTTGPDDFGLSPVRTLAHVAPVRAPSGFQSFWSAWRDRLLLTDPVLEPRDARRLDPADAGCDWGFQSENANIGGALISPPKHAGVRAALVVGHGYGKPETVEQEKTRWRRLAQRGVLVMLLRVRGFPGSSADTGDWLAPNPDGFGWICHGLDAFLTPAAHGSAEPKPDPHQWAVSQAVADTANAGRALADHAASLAGAPVPLYMQGISFSGGLAAIACAQLEQISEETPAACAVERLVLGAPTFGDWDWRLQNERTMGRGSGAELHNYLVVNRDHESALTRCFRLFDAAVHARRVHAATVARLAELDEVVPAPTAAAVFNALGAEPGRKWRFRTRYGHHDGGLDHARRYKLFERLVDDFLDPARAPETVMGAWAPALGGGTRAPAGTEGEPDTGAQEQLFDTGGGWTDEADAELIRAYTRAGRTLDDLPYTNSFDQILMDLRAHDRGLGAREVLQRLLNMRKAGRLPRLGRAEGRPVKVEPDEESLLLDLVTAEAGAAGRRDGLPYTPAFDRIVEGFNARSGRGLDPHAVWRLVAKLAK